MEDLYKNLSISTHHLDILNSIFIKKNNYTNSSDYLLYVENLKKLTDTSNEIKFAEELYSLKDRQMKLADIIEYIFFSRGIFSLINNNNQLIKKYIPKFLELILRFVNLLKTNSIEKKGQRPFLEEKRSLTLFNNQKGVES